MDRSKIVLWFFYIILDTVRCGHNIHATTQEPLKIDGVSDYSVFCKFQPNTYDCERKGRSPVHGFYYDIKMEDCKTTKYGSCAHNLNQFSTITHCHEMCRDVGMKPIINLNLSEAFFCRLQPDFGYCNDYYPMWYFDVSERVCKGFSYSGCGGNANRFHTAHICTARCASLLH